MAQERKAKDSQGKEFVPNQVVYVPMVVKDIIMETESGTPSLLLESALGGGDRISTVANPGMVLATDVKSDSPGLTEEGRASIVDSSRFPSLKKEELSDNLETKATVNLPPHVVNQAILNAPHTPQNTTNPPHTKVIGQQHEVNADASKLAMTGEQVDTAKKNQAEFEKSETKREEEEAKKRFESQQNAAKAGQSDDSKTKQAAGESGRMPDAKTKEAEAAQAQNQGTAKPTVEDKKK